jgi:CHASE3 domain sensor protein
MLTANKARFVFWVAIILVFVSGSATFVAITLLLGSQDLVKHTRDVQAALSSVNLVISRAGRTRVEYVDSGDLRHLEDHRAALLQIPLVVATLKRLVSDNTTQLARVTELEHELDERINLMHQSVALKQSGLSTLEGQSATTQNIVGVAAQMDLTISKMQE